MVAIISRPLNPARPARRWRFRLRTLFVVVLVAGLGLGWLDRHLRREREQAALIAELERARIYVYQYEPNSLGWDDRSVARIGTTMAPSSLAPLDFLL